MYDMVVGDYTILSQLLETEFNHVGFGPAGHLIKRKTPRPGPERASKQVLCGTECWCLAQPRYSQLNFYHRTEWTQELFKQGEVAGGPNVCHHRVRVPFCSNLMNNEPFDFVRGKSASTAASVRVPLP